MDKFITGTLPKKRQVEIDANIKKRKTRKYSSNYLNFGFAVIEKKDIEYPQCVICCKILAVECMLHSKLKHHLTTNHNYLSGKPHEYLKVIRNEKAISCVFKLFVYTSQSSASVFYSCA